MRRLPDTITEDELGKLIKATYKEEHKIAFLLGFYCGLRVSEVVNLKPEHIDTGRKLIMIKQGKGKKDRNIPFPKKLAYRFKHLPVKCGARALQIAFKLAIKRAKIKKDLHFHCLRHSCGTYWLKKGMDVRLVQQMLGHSRLDTTMIYTHVNATDVQNKMNEILGE